MRTRQGSSPRKRLLRALLMPVVGTALFGWFSMFPSADVPDVTMIPTAPTQIVNPTAGLDVKVLMAQHDCWTGESPYGDLIPGHAVYALAGQEPTYGPSQNGFDIWLHGKPGTLYGFCL